MSQSNLQKMWAQMDRTDYQEGLLAYTRYNLVMRELADRFGVELDRVVAAFCATSPNNDYVGNLRSVISLLDGYVKGVPFERVQITTYRHCGERAWRYLAGLSKFLDDAKGLKIRSFYQNILSPEDTRWVTVDGHMVAAWRGERLTMKEAICRGAREYHAIANGVKALAFNEFVAPCQYQAIIWFVRKRVFNVKYDGQLGLFASKDDAWRTLQDVAALKPYPSRAEQAPRQGALEPAQGLFGAGG